MPAAAALDFAHLQKVRFRHPLVRSAQFGSDPQPAKIKMNDDVQYLCFHFGDPGGNHEIRPACLATPLPAIERQVVARLHCDASNAVAWMAAICARFALAPRRGTERVGGINSSRPARWRWPISRQSKCRSHELVSAQCRCRRSRC